MTEAELDEAYSRFCKAMTVVGAAKAPLFMARFAVLAMAEMGDVQAGLRLIAAAQDGLEDDDGGCSQP